VIIHALTRLRRSYGFLEILKLIAWCCRGGWTSNGCNPVRVPGLICSQLCDDAYYSVTRQRLFRTPSPGDTVTPAHLSWTSTRTEPSTLTDIRIGWLRLID
ncbi:MAG: hypothetical protein WCK65_13245, partial [Rhodospirillaceae bacterium]